MAGPDLISLFVVPLNDLETPYMVTGAVAAVVYGEPRFTRDLDVVLQLHPDDAPRLASAFPGDEFYVPPPEVIAQEARRPRNGHFNFNLIHRGTSLKAHCYVAGDDPLHHWGMARRTRHDTDDVAVWVAPIEYVILRKLEWLRGGGGERHRDDIRAILRVSGDRVNRTALEEWIARLGLEKTWRSVARD